jgi:adsorption protein B
VTLLKEIVSLSFHDIWMLGTVFLCLLVILDDFFVDLLAWITGAKPKQISNADLLAMNNLTQKKMAILIANWHEDQVLERMVIGNVKHIDYRNYTILLGVYPNDTATVAAARGAERKCKNVKVIVNTKNGPTSKGQMINEMVNYINDYNKDPNNEPYDLIITHDAEDIIHKFALKLINLRAENYEFIQIPVFSLPTPLKELTAGIYIDEFTDSHTKNMLVRDRCRGGVPSAGVGTAVSKRIVSRLLKLQNGQFLKEETLTEDYFLGMTCYELGVKAHFAAEYIDIPDKENGRVIRDYIATREFFPQKIKASVKQKTRWTMGICLQGYEQESAENKSFFGRYFVWRDRKGLWCAPLFISSLVFTVFFMGAFFETGYWPELDSALFNQWLTKLMWANLILSGVRLAERIGLVGEVYGFSVASLVPVRWLLGNFINNAATFNAVYKYLISKIKGEMPTWSKTDHIIPVGFGVDSLSHEPATAASHDK